MGIFINGLTKEQKEGLKSELKKLNELVGTPYISEAKRYIISLLPSGYFLDFGLHSKQFCIVDYMGARVV